MVVMTADHLRRLDETIARRLGADDVEAAIFARCFLLPDLRGKDTQWIAGSALFCARIRDGAARFGAPFTVVQEGPSYAVVDGGHGLGQIVATRAMDLAIDKARASGVGLVWVRNTNDFAAASNYAMQ